MAYASRSGRARTSPRNPQAFAVCSRCSIWYNHVDLQWQMQWGGAALINTRILVCRQCLDRPQEQLRSLVLSQDPTPIRYALPEPFLYDETTGTTQPYGQPVGLEQAAIPPQFGTVKYGVPLDMLSVTANGTTTIAATCSTPHGLVTDGQISVEGLTNRLATGFYSVAVTSATAFQYVTYSVVPAGALITPTTRIVTALVGLPLGYTTIPQVGP